MPSSLQWVYYTRMLNLLHLPGPVLVSLIRALASILADSLDLPPTVTTDIIGCDKFLFFKYSRTIPTPPSRLWASPGPSCSIDASIKSLSTSLARSSSLLLVCSFWQHCRILHGPTQLVLFFLYEFSAIKRACYTLFDWVYLGLPDPCWPVQ